MKTQASNTKTKHWPLALKALLLGLAIAPQLVTPVAAQAIGGGPTLVKALPNSTQGPLWPPGEAMDENGDFIVVGLSLTDFGGGTIVPVPTPGVIVSAQTVPPLDENGREDFSNALGAPYSVLRQLDIGPGGADLDLVMYANSFGPPEGDFGGVGRVPREGESRYNLNSLGYTCEELFPGDGQRTTYTRPSMPLHEVPVSSFRGDGLQYDVDTGEPFDPQAKSGIECFPDGCPGEDSVDSRRTEPITLGEWLATEGNVEMQLTDLDPVTKQYTAARIRFTMEGLIPRSVYSIWAVRTNNFLGAHPDPPALPNVIIADYNGRGSIDFSIENPFPDPKLDPLGNRVIGFAVAFHPDYQNWGACVGRLGPGVDVLPVFNTTSNGDVDISDGWITTAPSR